MTISFETVLEIIQKGGSTALICGLVYIVYAFSNGRIVARWVYDAEVARNAADKKELKTDCDMYRQIAFRSTELAERSTAVAAEKVEKVRQP